MKNNSNYKNIILSNSKYEYSLDYKKIFGFWLYLMSDCIIFSVLFAVYAVMSNDISTFPLVKKIFKLNFVFLETIILLLSSMMYGLVLVYVIRKKYINVLLFLLITFILGLCFCLLELYDFYGLLQENLGPQRNGFLSSFFTLIGLHGIHVFSGLIWIIVMFYQIFSIGFTKVIVDRLFCLGLFWHFLDIIWIFIFTFVYLFGVL